MRSVLRKSLSPRRHGRELRFLLVFATISASLFFLYCLPWDPMGRVARGLRAFQCAYAEVVGLVVSPFDSAVSVEDRRVAGAFNMEIVGECDAGEAHILFIAAVVAYATSWRARALGIALGSTAIAAINVARLSVLYVLGVYWPSRFAFAHELSPPLLVGATLGWFAVWVAWIEDRAKPNAD
jgi:exosortase/archaeosortase family protein